MASLRDRLQKTLGDAYRLERELGGGGMSKVFVAEEAALGRKVVVKVLSSELAAEISSERFRREIQVSARLQHPHIVPVLASGETDGLPYYTMPFVEGEALRARLARDGAMSVAEAMPILRDVARALEYAHAHGVVHRDIKPDNILLAGSSATVADFGIAKAVSAARTETKHATLTSIGTTLGTPAYIAPEQAAGDADTDHRADIYSFGCMAFEMLTGETPFGDRTPQKLLVAHMAEQPRPIQELRLDLPQPLCDLVMRCLEKDPTARPQTAGELLKALDAAVSSGGHDAKPVIARATRRSLGKALLWWAVAFVSVTVLTRAFVLTVGLPAWAFPGVVALMLLGLPAILVTSFVHHRTRVARTMVGAVTTGGTNTQHSTVTRLAVKVSPWVTWRRITKGGAWALGAFGVFVAGWMLMWAFGIGSVGNLIAAGKIATNEPVLIADFASPASDTTLGGVVTEALRSDIAQSRAITPVSATSVRDMLRRAQRPLDSRVEFALARELATREGIKAVLAGDVLAAGGGYVLSARLIETQTGDVLAAFRETANSPNDVIKAIDGLSKAIREKLGESLRSVRAASPLYRASTGSLDALRKFTQGAVAIDRNLDVTRGLALVEEAIAIDTAFGMAYRKVAIQLQNMGIQSAKQREYFERAYAHRDRMSELERLATESNYYGSRWHFDADKYMAANEAMIAAGNPVSGYNNLGLFYNARREWAKAAEAFNKSIEADTALNFPYNNRYTPLGALDRWDEIEKGMAEEERRLPPRPGRAASRKANVLAHAGKADAALALVDSALRAGIPQASDRRGLADAVASLYVRAGRLRASATYRAQATDASIALGDGTRRFQEMAYRARQSAWFTNDKAAARALDDGLAHNALDSLPADDRPYLALAEAYALAGRPDRAKALVQAFDKVLPDAKQPADRIARSRAQGEIAIAEKRFGDAVTAFRAADIGLCVICAMPDIARAYDLSSQPDSAIATYERYLTTPSYTRGTDATQLAPARKRLAELYDAKGNRAKAIEHYKAFIELWKNADPELQPAVIHARQRLAALEKSGGD
jgi:tRNA A-37 threonylcarbamoyl transferase component Bud32/TolB-like protein